MSNIPAHRGFVPPKLPKPINPALAKHHVKPKQALDNAAGNAETH